MHWKEKQAKHQKWIEAGRDIGNILKKYPNIESHPFNIWHTNLLDVNYKDTPKYPRCECRDEGDRMLGIVPLKKSNGTFQLKIICWLCLTTSSQELKWDDVGESDVIKIFAHYFAEGEPDYR